MTTPSLEGIVNPDMLIWAREASHLDLEDVAARLSKRMTSAKLKAWEDGAQCPSLPQLRKLARIYKRSVGVFFLRRRPTGAAGPRDFRRLELSFTHSMSQALADGIRVAEAKRESALEIYSEWEEPPPVFPPDLTAEGTEEEVAQRILARLGISFDERRGWGSEYDALNAWKAAVESLGVMVMQVSGVPVREMRGCAIANFPLPVILLNSSDKPLGRIFTLMHELTHLIRAESGVCDVFEEANRSDEMQAIEVFCNKVAGAVLVPELELLRHPLVRHVGDPKDWTSDEILSLRRTFWASREAILRRLLIASKTTHRFYQTERTRIQAMFANDEGDAAKKGFVTYPRRVVLANGRFLTGLVVTAYDANVITGSQLSRILGAKIDHLPNIINVLHRREAA